MQQIKLDNFILEKLDLSYKDHQDVINSLTVDKNTQKYLGDLLYSFKRIELRHMENPLNAAYIAYYNDYPIGYISLSYMKNSYQLSIGILPAYRGQNMAALLTDEFSEYLFDNYKEINDISLEINTKNIGSIKSAILASYQQVGETTYKRSR